MNAKIALFLLFFAHFATALCADGVPVVVAKSSIGSIHPFENHIGSLKYATLSRLASQSAAVLESIVVDTGDTVKAGQPLATQESAILAANIAAKAAELKRAQASEAQAIKDAERYRVLLEQNSVSEQTHEQFRLKALELEAEREALAAQLEAMQIEKTKRTIRAPFDGVVVERHASEGDYLATGAGVVSVARSDSIELAVYLGAETLSRIKVGDRVVVGVYGTEYAARIAGISPRGDTQSRTFLTRVVFDKPSRNLIEGMEAVLKLSGKNTENALIVPRDAVVSRFGQQVVFYVVSGLVKMASVEVLGYDGLNAAVRSASLKEQMDVIVKGNERVFPDQAVSATTM